MEWSDEGLIIGTRKHGESSVILELMTGAHGRHFGLVKGGRSQRMRPVLQPGNSIAVVWRARLEDHLGLYAVEATTLRAARLMADVASLQGLNLIGALLRLLAEREPHQALYEAALCIMDHLDKGEIVPALLARFEFAMLAELGFGLDLATCAATGSAEELVFVSPKSGRAVSRAAGEPYRDRLLPLPAFLHDGEETPMPSDIRDAFSLAAYFLARDVFTPRGLTLPEAHSAYVAAFGKDYGKSRGKTNGKSA